MKEEEEKKNDPKKFTCIHMLHCCMYMTHLTKRNARNELKKNEITMETTAAANGYRKNRMQERKNETRRRNDETK